MNYVQQKIVEEAKRLTYDLAALALRARSAGLYLKGLQTPAQYELDVLRAATPRETALTGETHIRVFHDCIDL